MKKTALMIMIFAGMHLTAAETVSFAKIEPAANAKNEELCKLFKQKIDDYKKSMRDDDYAKVTLASYEERAALYCEK
jgi:hypothetical protein